MARFDYPVKLPNLIVDIVNALNAGNDKGTITGLKALVMLVKKYEFEINKKREPLYHIFSQIFEILGNLVNEAITNLNDFNLEVLYLACKVLYYSNQ